MACYQVSLEKKIFRINISIGHCPGAAQGAWKHAHIISMPQVSCLYNPSACPIIFLTPQHPCVVLVISAVSLLVRLVPMAIHDALNALPLP